MHIVYILYSEKLGKFYTGETAELAKRIDFHNSGTSAFTSKGTPWRLIAAFECIDRSDALILEKRIKRNGAERYLSRNNIPYSI